MKTRTLLLLIPFLICVGFIPAIGIFIVIGIILYLAYKEIGNASAEPTITNTVEIDEIFEDELERGR